MTDSNRRPPACKAGALPAELMPHGTFTCLRGSLWEILLRVAFRGRLRAPLSRRARTVVGLDGLEPSTLRLSGVRSNHLSYRPKVGCRLFWDRRNHPWVGAGRDLGWSLRGAGREGHGGSASRSLLFGERRRKRCPFLQSRAECGQLFAFGRERLLRGSTEGIDVIAGSGFEGRVRGLALQDDLASFP